MFQHYALSSYALTCALLRSRVLAPLLGALPRRTEAGALGRREEHEAAWAAFDACVSGLDLDHLGVFYTAALLLEAGVAAAVDVTDVACDVLEDVGLPLRRAAWAAAAARQCAEERARAVGRAAGADGAPRLSRQLDKVNKREVVAWVSFDVALRSAGSGVPERRAEAGRAYGWRPEIEERLAEQVQGEPLV